MAINGTVTYIGQEETGVGRTSGKTWRKKLFVVNTGGQYPKDVAFNIIGDNIDRHPIHVGAMVSVDFDPSSREYNGRWYTELAAWRINVQGAQAYQPQPANTAQVYQQQAPTGYAAPQYAAVQQQAPTPSAEPMPF